MKIETNTNADVNGRCQTEVPELKNKCGVNAAANQTTQGLKVKTGIKAGPGGTPIIRD